MIICADYLDFLRMLPDQSVDMILTDPPYNKTQCKWDGEIDLELLWAEIWRVMKERGVVVMTSAQPFSSLLVTSQPKAFRYDLIWKKNKKTGYLNVNRMPMREHEDILVFYQKLPTYHPQMTTGHPPGNAVRATGNSKNNEVYGEAVQVGYGGQTKRYPGSILEVSVVNNDDPNRVHPSQKPVELFEWLVKTYTNPGDLVVDCFMGSGTAGEAALSNGRTFLGCDTRLDFCQVSQVRISEVIIEPLQSLEVRGQDGYF